MHHEGDFSSAVTVSGSWAVQHSIHWGFIKMSIKEMIMLLLVPINQLHTSVGVPLQLTASVAKGVSVLEGHLTMLMVVLEISLIKKARIVNVSTCFRHVSSSTMLLELAQRDLVLSV